VYAQKGGGGWLLFSFAAGSGDLTKEKDVPIIKDDKKKAVTGRIPVDASREGGCPDRNLVRTLEGRP